MIRPALILGVAAMAACAVGGPRWDLEDPARVHSPSDLDEPPVLVECGTYQEPVTRYDARRATVQFVVAASGHVEAESVVLVPEGGRVPDERVNRAALAAALGCHYEPGELRGQAVRVRVRRTFYFLEG